MKTSMMMRQASMETLCVCLYRSTKRSEEDTLETHTQNLQLGIESEAKSVIQYNIFVQYNITSAMHAMRCVLCISYKHDRTQRN